MAIRTKRRRRTVFRLHLLGKIGKRDGDYNADLIRIYRPVIPAQANGGIDVRAVATAVSLLVLWLLMSGIYKPLIIGFGVAAAIIAVYVGKRMDKTDGDPLVLILSPIRAIKYLVWLFGEIAKSNIAVTRAIISQDMGLRQNLFRTTSTQKSDLGQVIFANSITLTPGTITVETEGDQFWVHALCYSEDDPDALDDMDRRVSAIETGGNG